MFARKHLILLVVALLLVLAAMAQLHRYRQPPTEQHIALPPSPAPPRPPEPERVSYFPAHRSSEAVLAYLEKRGTLEAARASCEATKRELPGDVFNSFLLAFCHAEMNDSAGEKAVVQSDFPDSAYLYDYLFRKSRAVLPEALRLLPAFKCRAGRLEIGHIEGRPEICPVAGAPFTKSLESGSVAYGCKTCDAALDSSRMPALMPVYEQATQNELAKDRISSWRGAPGPPVSPGELFHLLGFRPGQRIADIGCGLGYLVFPFAREAGQEGRVYAEEIDQVFVDLIGHGVKLTGAGNVVAVLGKPEDISIAEGTLDGACLCEVYKSATMNTGDRDPAEFERSVAAFFGSIRRALKKDGVLVVINKRDPARGMERERIRERVEGYGFRLARSLDEFRKEEILCFTKE